MSIKKRGHSEIDDEEDEADTEDEEEDTEDDEEEVFHGYTMLELYSVVINEIKGDHIHGKIVVERCVLLDPPTVVIYDGDEGKNNNIGEPLLLTAEYEPFLAYDPIHFWFYIGPKELEPCFYVWAPNYTPYNSVVTKEIVEEGWGKVTLNFKVLSRAVDAHVDVMFVGRSSIDDDGKKKYPTHVYGEISATCYGRIDTKVVLFRRKSKEEAEPVENRQPIRLSRSLIAAQMRSQIHIDVDLWGCYDDGSVVIKTSFVASFRVRPYPCTSELEPPGFESPVQVNVTWMERALPS